MTTIADAPANEAYSSGVSWPAVIGGAFVTAAFSLILLSLGTGLGLASVSPWANTGASASTIGAAAIVWLIMMQLVASALGGYLAGRLRTKWASIHTDEVFFRDTAHGFLSWAVAVVMTAGFLASAAASMAGGALQAGASTAAGSVAVVNGAAGQANDPGRVNNFDTTWFRVYCCDVAHPMSALDRPSSAGGGRQMTPSFGSSGVTRTKPVVGGPVVFAGGLIHTAVGTVSSRGTPRTNRSGCAA
jgi:hypothetical protein